MKKFVVVLMLVIILLMTVILSLLSLSEPILRQVETVDAEMSDEQEDGNELDTNNDIKIQFIDKTVLKNIDNEKAGTVIDKDRIVFEKIENYFTQNNIDKGILERIEGKSYPEGAMISLNQLRYVKLLHYNYNHEIQVGELIVNEGIAEDCVSIFRELFESEYEIESMILIDEFWTGDSVDSDTNSIAHNNTSSFNYRVVPGTSHLSNHAKGRAIDINPLQNPYVKYNSDGSFAHYYKDMELYLDRNSGKAHMITHQDECFKIFRKYGFTWGGDWNSVKDYQHFEKE